MNEQQTSMRGWRPSPVTCAVRAGLMSLGLCVMAVAAQAQDVDVPLYLQLTQKFQHDTNLLKDNRVKIADVKSESVARLGIDKSYGRQYYNLDARVTRNSYRDNSRFDNVGYTTTGSFVSDILADFRLTLDGSASRELPNFETNGANRTAKNTESRRSAGLDLRYGLHGRMSVNVGLSQSRLRYEVTNYDDRDSRSVVVGTRYSFTDLLSASLSYTKGKTDRPYLPILGGTGDEVDRDSLSLSTSWVVTGLSTVSASVGATRERYERDARRDFDGLTGAASWRYTPPGTVKYSLAWVRDTSNEGGQSSVYATKAGNFSGFNVANKVVNRLTTSAEWSVSSKVTLSTSYVYARYDEEKDIVIPGYTVEEGGNLDSTGFYNSLSFGVDYKPVRSLQLGCSFSAYDRTQSLYSQRYDGRSVGCYAGFTLQ